MAKKFSSSWIFIQITQHHKACHDRLKKNPNIPFWNIPFPVFTYWQVPLQNKTLFIMIINLEY